MVTDNIENTPSPDHSEHSHGADPKRLWPLLVGCIGVVYGDIGTSPLYAFREAASRVASGGIDPSEIYGILSLILWALIIIVTLKYVMLLLRADNKGEGGILSLMALTQRVAGRAKGFIFGAAIIGAALFYGDATITPAISVLSAVEGLKLVAPSLDHYILPLTVFILILLFSVQKTGTEKVAIFFGPITIVWFFVMAVAGVSWIVRHPEILLSFNPLYGFWFLQDHGWLSFVVLGSVFLAVTGAEALYADLGHFGRRPIHLAWTYFVLPALALNYLGQGAMILEKPETIENPFFLLVPSWGVLPMVILATLATIIASQAVITGAFSLTRQAIQLGLLPRLEIRHTSAEHQGQIYMPKVNSLLLIGVLLLCIIFRTSSSLASAYGIAVTGTMIASTLLSFFILPQIFNIRRRTALLIIFPFFITEVVFFAANMLKFFEGGFVPLLFAALIVIMVMTWVQGSRYLFKKASRRSISIVDLIEKLDRDPPHFVKGTAIFLTSDPRTAPPTLTQNLRHNKVLHEKNIILTVAAAPVPVVPDKNKLTVERLSSQIVRVVISFGYMETPDVYRALSCAGSEGFDIDLDNATFFLGRHIVISDPRRGLPGWQDKIYIAMSRSAVSATDFYRIPPAQVFEVGTQVTV